MTATQAPRLARTDDGVEAEQMEVILTFLRRAAPKFGPTHAFKVMTPSRRLPLADRFVSHTRHSLLDLLSGAPSFFTVSLVFDRQRIMVTQLTDFIRVYRKMTEQAAVGAVEDGMLPAAFEHFVGAATELQLEAMLNVYMASHTSLAVFLGEQTSVSERAAGSTAVNPPILRARSASVRGSLSPHTYQSSHARQSSAHISHRLAGRASTSTTTQDTTSDESAIHQALDRIRRQQARRQFAAPFNQPYVP